MDARQIADSMLRLLQADPKNYRRFGMYWYLIKALLKKFYTRDNLYMLGDYVDPTVIARIPAMTIDQALLEAIEEYQRNAAYGLGTDPVDANGESFVLLDPDANL